MTATAGQLALRYNGYHRVSDAREDPELTHTGPGTPCGEYFRRFWLPVAMTEQVSERPILVKVLGEELVLFRDLSGRIGLLHKHCSHRRASLEYGIVSERGIRCCYHGWLFDVDGTILETPGEPENSPIPRKLCHGAYPARELAGLVFAYLGPPELAPELPVLDTFSLPGVELVPYLIDYPCNWLQVAENPMDPFHSVFLHTRVTRAHFNPAWGAMPVVEWHPFEDRTGICLTNVRRWEDFIWVRTAEVLLPAIAQPSDIYQNPDREKFFPGVGITKWTVPVDDTHCRIIAWRHFGAELDLDGKGDRSKVGLNKVDFVGQTGVERSYEEGQAMPGDYEAQVSQGRSTVHAEERLATTDKGVALYRRMLRRAVRDLAAGIEPPQHRRGRDGQVPTMAGDVIVRVPPTNRDNVELQRVMGREVGRIVRDSMGLKRAARRAEIERRVRAWLGVGLQAANVRTATRQSLPPPIPPRAEDHHQPRRQPPGDEQGERGQSEGEVPRREDPARPRRIVERGGEQADDYRVHAEHGPAGALQSAQRVPVRHGAGNQQERRHEDGGAADEATRPAGGRLLHPGAETGREGEERPRHHLDVLD